MEDALIRDAILNRECSLLKFLLENRTLKLSQRADVNFSPLGQACSVPDIPRKMVKALLKHDQRWVNSRFEDKTALMMAAKNGRGDLVELLIRFGANCHDTDPDGRTVFHYATILTLDEETFAPIKGDILGYLGEVGTATLANKPDNFDERPIEMLLRQVFMRDGEELYASAMNLVLPLLIGYEEPDTLRYAINLLRVYYMAVRTNNAEILTYLLDVFYSARFNVHHSVVKEVRRVFAGHDIIAFPLHELFPEARCHRDVVNVLLRINRKEPIFFAAYEEILDESLRSDDALAVALQVIPILANAGIDHGGEAFQNALIRLAFKPRTASDFQRFERIMKAVSALHRPPNFESCFVHTLRTTADPLWTILSHDYLNSRPLVAFLAFIVAPSSLLRRIVDEETRKARLGRTETCPIPVHVGEMWQPYRRLCLEPGDVTFSYSPVPLSALARNTIRAAIERPSSTPTIASRKTDGVAFQAAVDQLPLPSLLKKFLRFLNGKF